MRSGRDSESVTTIRTGPRRDLVEEEQLYICYHGFAIFAKAEALCIGALDCRPPLPRREIIP